MNYGWNTSSGMYSLLQSVRITQNNTFTVKMPKRKQLSFMAQRKISCNEKEDHKIAQDVRRHLSDDNKHRFT